LTGGETTNDEAAYSMSKTVVRVKVRAVAVIEDGCGLFLGNEEKVFGFSIERTVGAAIARFLLGTSTPRPFTHELITTILCGLEVKVERVIIHELKRDAYRARLILSIENEGCRKHLIELEASPSDCIALAAQQGAPIYVSRDVWAQVEDVSKSLRAMQARGSHIQTRAEEGAC
jgi:uncharacterized protein